MFSRIPNANSPICHIQMVWRIANFDNSICHSQMVSNIANTNSSIRTQVTSFKYCKLFI